MQLAEYTNELLAHTDKMAQFLTYHGKGDWLDELIGLIKAQALTGTGYKKMMLMEAVAEGYDDIIDVSFNQLAPAAPIEGQIHMTALGERGGQETVYARKSD